jgi:hypothetical protein
VAFEYGYRHGAGELSGNHAGTELRGRPIGEAGLTEDRLPAKVVRLWIMIRALSYRGYKC